MDRAALAEWLSIELDVSLADAGIKTTDTTDGLAPILNRVAMLAPETLDESWLFPLAKYVALDRVVFRLSGKMDVTTGSGSYRLNQKFTNLKSLRDEAYAKVSWLVDPISSESGDVPVAMPFAVLVEGPTW